MPLCRLAVLTLLIVASTVTAQHPLAAAGPTVLTGTIAGAAYKIEVPSPWNGTLLLYSHGTVSPGTPNPALDVRDAVTGAWLLDHGYALAGSSFRSTGYALAEAFPDQIALLDSFVQHVGTPKRTIAWGTSLGGSISAGLVQLYPGRFSGALPMCGALAGGIGRYNQFLDATFAFETLLAPSTAFPLVHITQPAATLRHAEALLAQAQRTPAGRARVALAAALMDIPGWVNPTLPPPASDDVATQEHNQFLWFKINTLPFSLAGRAELEHRAGGNVSGNTLVNYRSLFARSIDQQEVQALYAKAGLNLGADLQALQNAPRIAADQRALPYLRRYVTYNGALQVPVLTLHTTGDGVAPVEVEQAYAHRVEAAGQGGLLRQLFVNRASHCSFTRAEVLTALQALIHRLDTGHWDDTTDVQALNSAATALGATPVLSGLPPTPPFYTTTVTLAPAFVSFQPAPFLGAVAPRSLD